MKKWKGYKIFNFIMKLISWCVMTILCTIGAFLIVYLCINKIAESKGKTAPLGLYTIISPSMTPKIDVYDVVVVVQKDPQKIEVGDIISYYSTNDYFGGTPITHRVVEKFNTNTGVSFRTRGDANPVVDNEIVLDKNVIGTVRLVIPQLGRIQFFLASKGGWFIAILVPAAGIIIYDIIKLAKLLSVKNKMKYAERLTEDEEPKKEKRTIEEDKIFERPTKSNKKIERLSREEKYYNREYKEERISRLFEDLEKDKDYQTQKNIEINHSYYPDNKKSTKESKTSRRK